MGNALASRFWPVDGPDLETNKPVCVVPLSEKAQFNVYATLITSKFKKLRTTHLDV
jgi:hypothetical protein